MRRDVRRHVWAIFLVLGVALAVGGCSKKLLKTSSADAESPTGEHILSAGDDTSGTSPDGSTAVGAVKQPSRGSGLGDETIDELSLFSEGDEGKKEAGEAAKREPSGQVRVPLGAPERGAGAGEPDEIRILVTPEAEGPEGSEGEKLLQFSLKDGPPDAELPVEQVTEPLIIAKAEGEAPASESPAAPSEETRVAKAIPQGESVGERIEAGRADAGKHRMNFDDIYFEFDRWAIPDRMVTRLTTQAMWLKNNDDVEVVIEGHCDARGSREYNLVLGERRARSILDFYADLGVNQDKVSIISYGKERLECFESEEECHAKNRRAHIMLR